MRLARTLSSTCSWRTNAGSGRSRAPPWCSYLDAPPDRAPRGHAPPDRGGGSRCLLDLLTEPFGASTLEWGALPLRLALGAVFIVSGGGKFRRGISGTGRWFEGLGFPFPQPTARAVASLELVGGALLIAGVFTHWVAIPLAANMVVATWVERYKIGAPFQGSESAQGYELTVLLAAASLALVLLGAGSLSVDALIN